MRAPPSPAPRRRRRTGEEQPGSPARRIDLSAARVFGVFLRLGLTSFGGPTAHLAIFHGEFVTRRRWLDEAAYADLAALCQFLPGPASSQTGLAIGYLRAGYAGAGAAWLGFTAPSAVLMTLFAFGFAFGGNGEAAWLHALKLVAVAVVAQAVWTMGRSLWTDRRRTALGLASAVVLLLFPVPAMQLAVIAAGALAGWRLLETEAAPKSAGGPPGVGTGAGAGAGIASRDFSRGERRVGALLLGGFGVSVLVLPLAAAAFGLPGLAVFDAFYRAGALVFGGGHVVLPLLEAEVVAPGWVSNDAFLAGYGAAQALPGPLFAIAAFLGAHLPFFESPLTGALVALLAIFAPSFLLVPGLLPFWSGLRRRRGARAALAGVNAAVVGLLLAALYDPLFTGSVRGAADFAWALGAFALLFLLRWPPWLVVVTAAVAAEAAERAPALLAGAAIA